MKFRTPDKHIIDLIFPLSVFFIFAVSSFAVILLAANIYRSQTADAGNHYITRTSLAYVTEKIHQSDQNGGISIRTLEGRDCLALENQLEDVSYTTYIYEYEGMLKELFIRSDAEVHLKDGKDIMEIGEFTMEEIGENLFRFTSVDMDGNTATIISSERSTQ